MFTDFFKSWLAAQAFRCHQLQLILLCRSFVFLSSLLWCLPLLLMLLSIVLFHMISPLVLLRDVLLLLHYHQAVVIFVVVWCHHQSLSNYIRCYYVLSLMSMYIITWQLPASWCISPCFPMSPPRHPYCWWIRGPFVIHYDIPIRIVHQDIPVCCCTPS